MIIPAYGATIEWSDDGVAYAAIPKSKAVVVPEVSTEYRDRTNLDSPNGFKEYGKGLKDGGELTISCYYNKALYAVAVAKGALANPPYIKVTLTADDDQSVGDEFVYRAWVTPSIPEADAEGDMMINLKLKVTGDVTWTQGAAA